MSELARVPDTIAAGIAYTIRRTLDDYPASDGWKLTLHLQGRAALHVESEADEDDHVLALTVEGTTSLGRGRYLWLETVSRGEGESLEGPFRISNGALQVLPDLINATAGSLQDPDEKALEIVRAVKEGRLSSDVAAYQLEGLGVTREDLKDILALEDRLRRRLARRHRSGMFAGKAYVGLRRPSGHPGVPR